MHKQEESREEYRRRVLEWGRQAAQILAYPVMRHWLEEVPQQLQLQLAQCQPGGKDQDRILQLQAVLWAVHRLRHYLEGAIQQARAYIEESTQEVTHE